MHEIDRSFRAKRMEAAERRARALRRRVLAGAAATVLVGLGAAAFVGRDYWLPAPDQPAATAQAPADTTAKPADEAVAKPRPVFVNPIIDLAGDPLIIRLAQASD